jgi:hypothetical protein
MALGYKPRFNLLSARLQTECNKTYTMVWADGASRLILTSGRRAPPKATVERDAAPPKGNGQWFFMVGKSGVHEQSEFLWGGLTGAEAPPVHAEAAGQRDQGLFSTAGCGVRVEQSKFPFAGEPIVGLATDQPPGQFGQCPA